MINKTVEEWKDRFLSTDNSIVNEIKVVKKLIDNENNIIKLNCIEDDHNTHCIAVKNLIEYKEWLEEFLKTM